MTLSDKTYLPSKLEDYRKVIDVLDVKESFKTLKEEMCQKPIKNQPCDICINCKTINKEAGPKLT